MCTCASCEYTDGFANKGFAAWPKGDPAGKRVSQAAYAAHVAASKATGSTGFHFTIRPEPTYPAWVTSQINMPVAPAPKVALDWIARSYAWRHSVMPAWEPGTGRISRPVSKLVAKARQYRAEAQQERRAA